MSRAAEKKVYSCAGKVRHETYSLALQASKRKPHGRDSARWPYRCRVCNGFHVGSGLPRTGQMRKSRAAPEIDDDTDRETVANHD